MRKWIVGLVVLIVLSGAALIAVQRRDIRSVQSEAPEAQPTQPSVQAAAGVTADAVVVPIRRAALNVPASGIVAAVLVEEGDTVEAGQLLLRLENVQQQAAVAQANAQRRAAQARLEQLKAGPRSQEIAGAEAVVAAADARLAQLREPPRAADVTAAEARLASAQAALQQLLEGPSEADVIAARRDLKNAEAALQQAQAAYDQVKWRNDIGALPQSEALQQATNNYEAAKARYNELQGEPSDADLAHARAEVKQAQAELQQVQSPGTESEIAAGEAELRQARAELELLAAGPRPEAIAAAEADVAAAEAGLQQAQAALDDTELRAPFAGTVGSLDVQVGEEVIPRSPVVQLADLSNWLIETDDLTEFNVVRVEPGDRATITFDALPDLTLSGRVVRIQPLGVNKQGDITYTVVVEPDEIDPRLRWNMTAVITIMEE